MYNSLLNVPSIKAQSPLLSHLDALGRRYFPQSYAGAYATTSTHLAVLAKQPYPAGFNTKIQQLLANTSYTYSLVSVTASYADLQHETLRIAKMSHHLHTLGFNIVTFGPDTATGNIRIILSDYTPTTAQKLLTILNSSLIRVAPYSVTQTFTPIDSRFDDFSPYYAGDAIWKTDQTTPSCASGIPFIGNYSGRTFAITAGHCHGFYSSGTTWYTNNFYPQAMGSTSTNYFNNTNGIQDFESIQGSFSPNTIWANNAGYWTTCGLTLGYSSWGGTICQPGDSGGPVYVHESTPGYVQALGQITAVPINNGVNQTNQLIYR